MDPAEMLAVKFHYLGEFVNEGRNLQYVGGRTAMSHVDRDKISLPEIKGHLADHVSVKENWRLHWLYPGLPLYAGLGLLVNDVSCMRMSTYIKDGMVVDMYVENAMAEGPDKSDHVAAYHEEVVVLASQYSQAPKKLTPKRKPKVADPVPTKKNKIENPLVLQSVKIMNGRGKQIARECVPEFVPLEVTRVELHSEQEDRQQQDRRTEPNEQDSDSSDDDYQPNEEDSEAENSEAEEMRKYADQFKREMKAKKLGVVAEKEADFVIPEEANILDDDGNTSEEDGWSYDEVSDGEGGTSFVKRKSIWPRFNSSLEEPKFSLGMAFSSRSDFKDACKRYGLVTFRHIAFDKDEATKIRAKCTWPTCKWSCYASKSSRSTWFQIVTLNDEHHCVPRRNNKLVTSRVIAQKYGNLMKANPCWKISSIKQTVLEEMMADVSEAKCKRARKLVFQQLFDRTLGEYSKVFDYQKELLRSNPGSTVAVKLDPYPEIPDDMHVFQRFYVCFDACKRGFAAGCRKVIGLDGCFFKGACKGELICAIGKDANNGMYPVAWAVVEKECNNSWFWFLGLLIRDLNINDHGEGWVFISDQQKGLINAISDLCPNAEHRNCARHMYANWKKRHTDHDWKKMWWRCAKAPCKTLFNYHRAKLAQKTVEGAQDMMRTSPTHWSRAFFKLGSNCDSVDNNTCESFNNAIISSRYLPIISMLESIRCKIMVRIQENGSKAEKWVGAICPNIFKKLKMNIRLSSLCQVMWNGREGYEVKEHERIGNMRFTVNLEARTCSCRYWQLSGMPCCHAISAIYCAGQEVENFIADCYSIIHYKKTYECCLEPVEGEESWEPADHPRPEAPAYIKPLGRPATERRREEGEAPKAPKGNRLTKKGIIMKCGCCGSTKHNKRTCKNNPNSRKYMQAQYAKQASKQSAAAAATSKVVQLKGQGKNTNSQPSTSQSSQQNIVRQPYVPSHCVIRIGGAKEKTPKEKQVAEK